MGCEVAIFEVARSLLKKKSVFSAHPYVYMRKRGGENQGQCIHMKTCKSL